MLTPVFSVSQTHELIIIEIRAKYVKPSAAEVSVDGNMFFFNVKPFYLRLQFSNRLTNLEESITAKYVIETGVFIVRVPKLNPGEEFQDLDMLQKLLQTGKQEQSNVNKIEVLNEYSEQDVSELSEEVQNWEVEQRMVNEDNLINSSTYGFGNLRSDIFQKLEEEAYELFENYKISNVPNSERRNLRLKAEKEKFNEEHYLGDLFEPFPELEEAISDTTVRKLEAGLSPEEKAVLVSMKNSLVALNQNETRIIYCGLVEIIFSFCYVSRSFKGEIEPEASWMLSKISPTLSWLDTSDTPRKSVHACFRRCMIYPLYRSFRLATEAQKDTVTIISSGREMITKILLTIRSLFNRSDPYYLLNQLYIDDYIIWIQSIALEENLNKLATNIAKYAVKKNDMALDLVMLERTALIVMEEGSVDSDEELISMEEAMDRLNIELGSAGNVSCEGELKEKRKLIEEM